MALTFILILNATNLLYFYIIFFYELGFLILKILIKHQAVNCISMCFYIYHMITVTVCRAIYLVCRRIKRN